MKKKKSKQKDTSAGIVIRISDKVVKILEKQREHHRETFSDLILKLNEKLIKS